MKSRVLPGYTKVELARLRAKALELFSKSERPARSVSHVLPRVYCVAKPARMYAVFAVPPCDRQPQVRADGFVIVQDPTAYNVQLGDWCATAYVVRQGVAQNYVIERYCVDPAKAPERKRA